jgi:hypothetical protein
VPDPDIPEESAETPNITTNIDDNATPNPQDPPPSSISNASKRGPRSGLKRGKGGRGGFSNREDAGSPASGIKNGKDASASPGVGSGADSSGTGAAPIPNRRGRPGHGANSGAGSTREPTMTELKKRASLMLDIIAQSQLEMTRAESRGLVKDKAIDPDQNGAAAAGLAGDLATRLVKWQHEFTLEAATVTESGSAKG